MFCASIRPDEGDWDVLRFTLDEDYDHVSEIGQPAKFAQALARIVTEQIGPRGKDAWLTGTSDGAAGASNEAQAPVGYSWADRIHRIGCTKRLLAKRMKSGEWRRVCSPIS